MSDQPAGRVLQVNVSAGGVPKRPVDRARIGRFGLEGDAHRDNTVHGGPHRAVCLFGIEAIERLQAEGHPIGPGGAGENLTTSGIEWSLLPVGTRARIGADVELEVSGDAGPCKTIQGNFSDSRFSRMSIDIHPSDSRMYTRVVRGGEVRPGDPITLLPPAGTGAADDVLLRRLNRAETKSTVAAWGAAKAAGFAIDFVEDGEMALASSPDIPGPAFNSTHGLARLPNMLSMATDFYDARKTTGYLWMAEEPWPRATSSLAVDIFGAAAADAVADAALPDGVVIRRIGPGEAAAYTAVRSGNLTAGGVATGGPNPWPDVYEQLARTNSRLLFVAELDGVAVGNGSLHISARTGWLRGALVAPEVRGRGIQRALIAVRVQAALDAGCDLVGASAEPTEVSARNLARMGMRRLGQQTSYEYMPKGVA